MTSVLRISAANQAEGTAPAKVPNNHPLSEHFGRFQVGVTGFYAFQVEDDELFGIPIPPDGRQAEVFQLGPVLAYDMPERGSSVKIKALTTLSVTNSVESWAAIFGWIKKF